MRIQEIEETIRQALAPQSLMVIDESHLHRGHAGDRPYGQSHYRVVAVAEAFAGKGRVERQRMVHAALGPSVGSSIHALSLNLHAPGET